MTPILSSAILRTQSDARLLALASRGGTDGRGAVVGQRAFEAIVERYRRPLHRWCRSVLPEARAEDAVQTAFLKAWSALQAGTDVSDLRPWLYRIARNAALDNARKAGYDYDELSDALALAPAPESELERRTVIRETLTGVAGLPDNQRAALLRTAAGHSRAEIARDLQVTEGSVRQLVHRARTTLRAAATAITPLPLVSWAAALGAEAGGPTAQRIAELTTGVGSAGIAATAVKAGTVLVAAGVLAAGPGSDLRRAVVKDDPAAAADQPRGHGRVQDGGGAAGANATGPGGAVSLGTLAAGVVSTGSNQSRRSGDSGKDPQGSMSRDDGGGSGGHRGSDDIAAVHWPDDSSGHGRRGADSTPSDSTLPQAPSSGSDHAPSPGSGSSGSRREPEPSPPPETKAPDPPPPPEPVEPPSPSGKGRGSGSTPTATVPHD
jgi:RNA polymerase sigma factor (sigma-70 family)